MVWIELSGYEAVCSNNWHLKIVCESFNLTLGLMFLLMTFFTSNNFASLYGFKIEVFSVKRRVFQKILVEVVTWGTELGNNMSCVNA